jgi:positive regulator of sigma E activity
MTSFDFLKEGTEKMGRMTCKLWKETHENCSGCESEKACKEFVTRAMQHTTAVLIESKEMTLDEAEVLEIREILGEKP